MSKRKKKDNLDTMIGIAIFAIAVLGGNVAVELIECKNDLLSFLLQIIVSILVFVGEIAVYYFILVLNDKIKSFRTHRKNPKK